jgi:hypothetical protein|tara:strand:+ start:1649 stop:2119 length:471 start_codon:yes stop_codon:yes gene_type:complete
MKDYQLNKGNLSEFFDDIQKELEESHNLIVSTQSPKTGKWGMARLWRSWMAATAKAQAANGVTMPLMIKGDGSYYGTRPFNEQDAHELFTHQWLGVGSDGMRLSWAKKDRDGMRAATKGERFTAMYKHDHWCLERGIILFKPRDSEYSQLEDEQNR